MKNIHMSKVILITGASTGIGFAIAKHLSDASHKVFSGVRKKVDAQKIIKHTRVQPIYLDVTKEVDIINAKILIEKLGHLDVLINNAGLAKCGPIELVSVSDYKRVFEVNVFALLRVTQIFLPLLRKTNGRIINISSITGKQAGPFSAPYSASKHAVEALTDCLRREVSNQGIKVVSINPARIKSDMSQKVLNDIQKRLMHIKVDTGLDHTQAIYEKPLKRLRQIVENSIYPDSSIVPIIKTIEKAIFSKKPKTRYFPGKNVLRQAFIAKFASDRLIDKIILKKFNSKT